MSNEFDIDKVIEALAKKLGTSKDVIVKTLLEAFLKKSSRTMDSIKVLKELGDASFFRSSVTIDDIFRYRLMEKLMSDSSDVDLNRVMAFAMLRQLFQPDLTTLMLLQRIIEKGGSSSNDMLYQYLMQQQQHQQQLMTLIIAALFGKHADEILQNIQSIQQTVAQQQEQLRKETDEKLKSFAETMAKEIDELKKDRRELIRYFKELSKTVKEQPSAMQILLRAINEYKQLQQALQDAARELGLKKEEIPVTREGKVDWGALLNRVLDIAEKYVEVQRQQQQPIPRVEVQPPPPREVEELPETEAKAEETRKTEAKEEAKDQEARREGRREVEVQPTVIEGGGEK